ncbi:ElyC/SanA/YdcF family protein [Streptococcus ruminantium]|uniref:ElyC/SanA/YdcF family protein n=2 Tax=Streptococcus ruminantium TaxID=1917441 RepID=UPI0012DD58FC|nr:ElyC/SanA/YdcF family protein [Streptococcus ruminantium]
MFNTNNNSYRARKFRALKLTSISTLALFWLLSSGPNVQALDNNSENLPTSVSVTSTIDSSQSIDTTTSEISTETGVAENETTTLISNDDSAPGVQTRAYSAASDTEEASISKDFYENLTNERVDYTSEIGFDFYSELPAPGAKADGRGEPLEKLISNYGDSYANDSILSEDVTRFRRWEWQDLYKSLDQKAQENPDYLNTYRLQAEVYLVNKNYKEAFSQLDRILRRDPSDIHALSLSILAAKVTGEKEQVKNRLAALKYISPEAEEAVHNVLKFSDSNNAKKVNYGSDQLTDMVPDVIAVFGQSPNPDGTPSSALITRLEKTKEMAERYPDIPIVLSGGPVRYEYAEADVMAKWLVENGISADRLILDDIARDTPGNAVGMVKAFKEFGAKKVLAVGTILHLPRATTVLKVYADAVGYDLTIDSAGGGTPPSGSKQEGERLYTYVNALRAGFLYTKDDFNKFSRRTVKVTFKDHDEKVIEEREYKLGEKVDFPTLARDGFNLKGWATNSEGTKLDEFFPKLDTTLYAIWEKNPDNLPSEKPKEPIQTGSNVVVTKAPEAKESNKKAESSAIVTKVSEDKKHSLPETASAVSQTKSLPKTNSVNNLSYSLFGFCLVGLSFTGRKKRSKNNI